MVIKNAGKFSESVSFVTNAAKLLNDGVYGYLGLFPSKHNYSGQHRIDMHPTVTALPGY